MKLSCLAIALMLFLCSHGCNINVEGVIYLEQVVMECIPSGHLCKCWLNYENYFEFMCWLSVQHPIHYKADSRLAPSQWETSLQSNAVSHWLGANLESALPYGHVKSHLELKTETHGSPSQSYVCCEYFKENWLCQNGLVHTIWPVISGWSHYEY